MSCNPGLVSQTHGNPGETNPKLGMTSCCALMKVWSCDYKATYQMLRRNAMCPSWHTDPDAPWPGGHARRSSSNAETSVF
jgi:hypothetical protein